MNKPIRNSSTQPQSGAVLVVSLIMLLVMTIIGIAAMRTTVLQEKMAGNVGDLNRAFEASEAALRQGERWVNDLVARPDTTTSCAAPCEVVWDKVDATLNPIEATSTWDSDNVRAYAGTIPAVAALPEYYIEHDEFLKDNLNVGTANDNVGRDLYRMTARGVGSAATTQAIVRTAYARRF
ncbi:MAG: pilus assembly protein PilZ [Gammaproteobacteria bacterium]|nr:pilus assembly protein PilZ [Gammaproteobacteria bacterium]